MSNEERIERAIDIVDKDYHKEIKVNDTSKTIYVECKNKYGIDRAYPTCDFGKMICQLTTKATLLPQHIDILKRNGYIVKEKKEREL
tara:strand:+ start:163 stop:423 length:261 start_codon:yes stop_codon:yes gene_type:complete